MNRNLCAGGVSIPRFGSCPVCGASSRETCGRRIAELIGALDEAERQIAYLHEKFGETGSGNAVLARIRAALAKADTTTEGE